MHLRPRRLRPAAALTAVLVLATGCRVGGEVDPLPTAAPSITPSPEAPSAAEDRRGGSLRFGLGRDPGAIDPRFVADDEGRVVADALFDSLVALDGDLRVIPAAAERWQVNADATEFTFHLRRDATFHDGTPVTASAFVRSFERIVDGTASPRSFVAYRLSPVQGFEQAQAEGGGLEGLEAVDEHTLVIRLRYPFAEFVASLADPSLAPVPPSADTSPGEFHERPVGNGPFQMAEPWQHNQFIRVARYADHPAPARLDEVVFHIYADDPGLDGQHADLRAGQLHFAELPVAQLQTAIEEFGLSDDGYTGPGVLDGVSSTIYYYGFNTARPPFDDPDVRRAVSLLIDREAIVEEVTAGSREVADAIVPPSIPGAQDDVCDTCRYDPEEAAALVGDRSLGTLRLLYNTGRTHQAIAEAVQRSLEQHLDVEVELVAKGLQAFVRDLRAGEMELFRLGWEADYPSPGSYLLPLFHSSNIGTDNLTRYADPEVDELLVQARGETDLQARRERYHEVERTVLDQAVVAPVLFYRHHHVVAPDVRELVYGPLGTVDLSRVWLEVPS